MPNEPPPDDERPDESTDENRENQPDENRGNRSDDGSTGGDSTPPSDRHPPVGPGSTDRWPSEATPESGDSGDDTWLSSLLTVLDSLDRTAGASGSGQTGGRFGLEYDVSIGSGLESNDSDSARQPPERPSRVTRGSAAGRDPTRNRSSRTRRRRSSPSSHRVTTRTYDDVLLVIADVSSVDPETVTVGFDGDGDDTTLVVGVGDRELERVEVPWDRSSVEADARIKNGVLTVTVSTDDLDDSAETASGDHSGLGDADDFGGGGRE